MQSELIKLLLSDKEQKICNRFFSLYKRLPKLFSKHLFHDLKRFLLYAKIETHSDYFLSRIFYSQSRLIKLMEHHREEKIHLKILEINTSTLGFSIAILLNEQEIFNEKHIIKAIQNLVPGIKPVPNTSFSYKYRGINFFYIEIKKVRGGIFSKNIAQLITELPSKLSQEIVFTSPSLCIPGNEEEVFKNIRNLSNELHSPKDIPQVMASLAEFSPNTIKFLIIVLRVVTPNSPSIATLSANLPSLIEFSEEPSLCIANMEEGFKKEASVFSLSVNSSTFKHSHSEVNLRSARHFIIKSVESMVGPLRDYNGGLLIKENEQFQTIKHELAKQNLIFSRLNDLFYAVTPITFRSLILPSTGAAIIRLFQKMESLAVDEEMLYQIDTHISNEANVVIIKANQMNWKSSFTQHILSSQSNIGSTYIKHEGYDYLFFFNQYPSDSLLPTFIRKELELHDFFNKKNILHINFQIGDPPSLNPRLAFDIHCHTLANTLFEGLTRFNALGKVENAIAEKIEISPSQLHYTFHLRPAWWSNGEPLTAYHFEKAWKRGVLAVSPGGMCPDFYAPIKNVQKVRKKNACSDELGIQALDEKTLTVELESPCTYFLNLLASPPYFPLLGESEEPFHFNGPFTVTDWKKEQWIYLSQNPFYRDGKNVTLSGIRISLEKDPYKAFKKYQKQELDLLGDPISPIPPDLLTTSYFQDKLIHKDLSRIFWIHCNTHAFPLQNVHLRRALSLALNRKRLTEKAFIKQLPHCSVFPPKYASHKGNIEGDLDLAEVYIELARKELQTIPPIELLHSDLSFEKPLVKELKAQWEEKLGLRIITKELPWNEFSAAIEKGEFQLGGLFRRDIFNHPIFYAGFFKPSPYNPHSWNNTTYQSLLQKFETSDDQEVILREIESLLIHEVPVIPLVSQRSLSLVHNRIHNMVWLDNGCPDFKEVSIDEKSFIRDSTHSMHNAVPKTEQRCSPSSK